jgi:hypothetical protein
MSRTVTKTKREFFKYISAIRFNWREIFLESKLRMDMKRLAAILVVAMFSLSCGQASKSTTITSDLDLILPAVPSELASNNVLWFSNMQRIKQLAGASQDTDANEFLKFLKATTERAEYQRRLDLLSGYTLSEFSGGTHLEYWQDAFGYDAFAVNQEITVRSLLQPNSTRPLFSVMRGNFDKNKIIGKLNNLGYQLKNYASTDYYSIRADNQTDLKSSRAATMAMAYLNRMMVKEQELIAAPADDIFFSILDVRSGKQRSLKDSLTYSTVAGILGQVLGAALVPQSQLRSENVSMDWDKLHTYDLAGIGYRVEGQDRKLVIALHYTNKSAASDVNELNRRMAEYVVTSGGSKTPLLSDLFDIGEPEVAVYGSGSILKVELVYNPDSPSTLWSDLVESQDLGFLVCNPSG